MSEIGNGVLRQKNVPSAFKWHKRRIRKGAYYKSKESKANKTGADSLKESQPLFISYVLDQFRSNRVFHAVCGGFAFLQYGEDAEADIVAKA